MHPKHRACAAIVLMVAFSFQNAAPATVPFELCGSRQLSERNAAADRALLRRPRQHYPLLQHFLVAQRRARLRKFYEETKAALAAQNFDTMARTARSITSCSATISITNSAGSISMKRGGRERRLSAVRGTIVGLEESRQKMNPLDPIKAAQTLGKLNKDIDAARRPSTQSALAKRATQSAQMRRIVGNRAANEAASLRGSLRTWFTFYNGYDPMFTWWDEEAYRTVDTSLQNYTTYLREQSGRTAPARPKALQGVAEAGRGGRRGSFRCRRQRPPAPAPQTTSSAIPSAATALMSELAYEMIPYTPEQLITIANKEFAWCETEMKKASREMGFGDDWHAALEKVKTMYVEPGKQPQMIRDLALEAEKFLDDHDLVTVPPIARESWRMDMMTPERQLVAPFFLGGEVIRFPTRSTR